jgi:predicted ATPase with chaperone activity
MSYIQNKLLEKHICRFNDGECNCDCYIAGITDYHNHIVEMIQKQIDDIYEEPEKTEDDISEARVMEEIISLLQDNPASQDKE